MRRYAKAGVLVVVLIVLVAEGYFGYRWYDRYHGHDAATPGVAGNAADPNTVEDTGPGAARDTEDADPADGPAFVHTATEENSRGDYTYLTHPSIDGDPNAVVLATPSPDQGNAGDGPYDHNIGVWFEPEQQRWAIFNQDRAPVPAGAVFEVSVPEESGGFVHRAGTANTVGNATYLDDPLTNGEPDAALSVTQNWNPGGSGGVYNDHPVGVLYDEDVDRWAVYNRDDGPMPGGAAFNVAVSGGAEPAG